MLGACSGGSQPAATSTPGGAAPSTHTEIVEADTGKKFAYPTGTRFRIVLDETTHPQIDVACNPATTLNVVTVPPPGAPMVALGYEGASAGTCNFTSGRTFHVVVQIAERR
jgi:hypothetical protein